MPQAQVIDLSPLPRRETPFDKTLAAFSERFQENQGLNRLQDIYKEYQEGGKNLEDTIMKFRTTPGISPSARTGAITDLLNVQKINQELQNKSAEDIRRAQAKSEKIESNKKILSDLEQRNELPAGSLDAYAENPAMALQAIKPKPQSRQLLANQQIEPEQLDRIQQVRNTPQYEEASPSKKYQILTDAGVSRQNAESEVKIAAEEAKLTAEGKKAGEAQSYLYHKETAKQDEELSKAGKGARNQLDAIKDVEKALASGNVRSTSLASLFKGIGPLGEKISEALTNKDEAVVQASIPAFLEGRKELFGVRISDADLKLLSDKLPGIGKSMEANKAILGVMKKYSQASLLRSKIASEVKKENKGLRPLGYLDQIEDKYDEMTKPVKVINPSTGNVIEIPSFQLNAALLKGAKLANE